MPRGTPIEEKTLQEEQELEGGRKVQVTKHVLNFTIPGDQQRGLAEKQVQLVKDEDVVVLPASEIPKKYADFATSGLTHTIEALPAFTTQKKRYNLPLE